MQKNTYIVALVAIAIIAVGGWFTPIGSKVVDTIGGTTNYDTLQVDELISTLGTVTTLNVSGATTLSGAVNLLEDTASPLVATPLTVADSGTTIYMASSTGLTYTLPAVASSAGTVYKFVVAAAFATSNAIIASAEGDNIEGALIVAGAVVDCDAEDFVNFVADGENLGDFVELRSDGTSWFIGASGGLASAKMTCTDPS